MKNLSYYLFCCVLLVASITCVNGQTPSVCGVDFEIKEVLNSSDGKGFFGSRKIYILLDENDFSRQNLERLFKFLTSKYSSPNVLTIKIFTDLESLNKMIDYDNPGVFIDFPNDEAGIRAYKQYDEQRYPKPKGFYAAYYRDVHSEYFIYSSKKDENDLICVTIESKGNF